MLILSVNAMEEWDEDLEEFISCKPVTLQLEHSLVSISKWEAQWEKPFLDHNLDETELRDYIRCMTINSGIDSNVYALLSARHLSTVQDYINAKRTATTINKQKTAPHAGGRTSEGITSELIYYWMINYNIPMECQKWHLNRLLTLIRVCNVKNNPPKKMSQSQLMSRNAALNAARRKQLHTKG